jgi:hypothetical protein
MKMRKKKHIPRKKLVVFPDWYKGEIPMHTHRDILACIQKAIDIVKANTASPELALLWKNEQDFIDKVICPNNREYPYAS